MVKEERKLNQKSYLKNQNLLIAQYLWQALYQILSMEGIHKIKCKHMNMIIKNVLNTQMLKII